MTPLSTGHRAALLLATLLAMGALGPWATGVWEVRPIMDDAYAYPRETYGGWLAIAPALVAVCALLLIPDARLRSLATLVAFAASLGMCLLAWGSDGYQIGWTLEIFAGWQSVAPGWGLQLATLASALGIIAAAMGLPRRDPFKGAYF